MPRARAIALGLSALLVTAGGVLGVAAPAAAGGPAVTPAPSASAMVSQIVGGGVAPVTGAVYTGASGAAGLFSGFGALGMTDGVVLSSGSAAKVVGPNTSGSTSTNNSMPGDPSLVGQTEDAASLEFDVVPASSPLSLDYIFGSEEYPEFVNASYSDQFAIFVNGANCATLPDGTPVGINTVNNAANSRYYQDGTGSSVTQMDGYTVPLTCRAAVTPGQVSHVKIVIADSGDPYYDSWLLLGAHSVTAEAPPVADPAAVSTDQGLAVPIALGGSDPNGDALTYAVTSGPAHGTLSGTAPNLVYTPDPTFSGTDTVSYTVSDGTYTSPPATVTITVTPNLPPTAGSGAVDAGYGGSTPVHLSGSDPEGAALTYTVDPPAHGSLTGTAPDLLYTPDAGYVGADSVTFTVSDGRFTSAAATVAIDVVAPTVSVSGELVPGGDIVVSGAGLAAGVDVSVELHSTPVLLGTAQSVADGTWSLAATIPTATPLGRHDIVAILAGLSFASQGVQVAAPASTVTGGSPPPAAAPAAAPTDPQGRLAATGLSVPPLAAALAALAILVGVLAMHATRRPRRGRAG